MTTVQGDLPSGTVTFLFTDVEGSTTLLHELGAERYAEALAEHRRILRAAFAAEGGVEVDTQGDAFFVAFPTAPGALEAAAQALIRLAPGPIRVRIGIHTGDPHLTEVGYVGVDVHRAARIAACGHGGQVLVSAATAALLDEEGLRDLGEHRLKDFDEPMTLYQLGDARFPPLKTISNTNLPRPASSFVGRDEDLDKVTSLLQGGARLLTLTGPGGSGKTRLAIEAAAELVPEFKAGVFWVGLAPLRDPALVPETIGQTLGAKDGLAEHIGERELLLLLDNLEQVIEAAPELASLVEACPNLKLLTTSRELLRVRGEVGFPVLPLAEPEAVELFCARARTERDETVHELCRALDNLPLALELAAARTSVLSPKDLLERLSGRLDLFTGGRDADPRQQTIRATIEWSYELLAPEEQRLFARLSVFSGGCTLEAVEEVAETDLDTLQSLVDKSLLRHTDDRFWMLETIREYAAQRLEESAEGEELRRRQAEHVRLLAESARPHLQGAEQEDWLRRIEVERDNIRSALDWALESGAEELALEVATALGRFWWVRGPAEGLAWLERALALAKATPERRAAALEAAGGAAWFVGDHERALHLFEKGLALFREIGDRAGSAMMLTRLGPPLEAAGRPDEARAVVEESLAIHRELGQQDEIALALNMLGAFALGRGDRTEARALLEESAVLAREFGDSWQLEYSLLNLAEVALEDGDLARAVDLGREGLTRAREIGDEMSIAWGLTLLSITAARRGDQTRAGRLWEAVEQLDLELGETMWRRESARYEELLGERGSDFDRGREDGRAMSLEEAVAYALEGFLRPARPRARRRRTRSR